MYLTKKLIFMLILCFYQEDQEKKRLEQLQKKAEAKALLEKEMQSIKAAPKAAPPPPKITRAQIERMKEKTIKAEPVKPVVTLIEIGLHVLSICYFYSIVLGLFIPAIKSGCGRASTWGESQQDPSGRRSGTDCWWSYFYTRVCLWNVGFDAREYIVV